MDIVHVQSELMMFMELEIGRLERISMGIKYKPAYVDYLIEGVLTLLISIHERVIAILGGQHMDELA